MKTITILLIWYIHEWLIQVQWIHSSWHPFIFCTPWEDIPIIQGNTCLSDPWHCCYFILLPRHYICAVLVFMSRSNLFEIFSKDGLRNLNWASMTVCRNVYHASLSTHWYSIFIFIHVLYNEADSTYISLRADICTALTLGCRHLLNRIW